MNDERPPADATSASDPRHVRYGLILFAIYLLLYVGFMALAAFAPGLMAAPWLGGVNLAIGYGMGLIVAAFLLAVLYWFLCWRVDRGKSRVTSNQ